MSYPSGLPGYTLGFGVIRWCHKYLVMPGADGRWRFTDTQAHFILWYYAVDERGRWLYHRGAMRTAKGTGKSPFVAAMALAEFLGPVRFDYFDPSVHGGVVGKPEPMPWVQIAATAESQTVNTMAMVSAMVPPGSRCRTEYGLDVGKTQIFRPANGGRLEIITASAHSAEGNRTTFAIEDETEWWTPSTGGVELDGVIRRNLAKTNGRLIETCNAFVPGMDSVAEKTHDAVVLHETGEALQGGILYYAREAPADTNPFDDDSLRAGLEEAYRDAPWIDIDRMMIEYRDPSTVPSVARRFYLNQIVAGEDDWTSRQSWEALADPSKVIAKTEYDEDDIVIKKGDMIALFFDGSKSRDHTGLVGCRMSDGHVFLLGHWTPGKDKDGRVIEINAFEVDGAVRKAFRDYDVVAFFADVREWESFVKVTWPEDFRKQLLVWAQKGGKEPLPIAWDMRTKDQEFTFASETAWQEIQDGMFTHDGSAALTRHVLNSKIRNSPKGWGQSIRKETQNSPNKIDLAVCMIGARMVRRMCLADKEYQRKARRAGAGPLRATVFSGRR